MILLVLCVIIGYVRLKSEIHGHNAIIAHRNKNWPIVIAEIDRANTVLYQLDPATTPLYWYRGIAKYRMGYFREALCDFRKAYKAHPRHYHVLNNLGTSYAKLGNYERAGKYYQKAIDIFPGLLEARANLGIVSIYLGNIAEARRLFLLGEQEGEGNRISVSHKNNFEN